MKKIWFSNKNKAVLIIIFLCFASARLCAQQYIYWTEYTPDITQTVDALSGIRSIAIDDVNNKIYWTTSAVNNNKICRANLDGTETEILIEFGAGSYNIRQIAIDVPANKMYWADFTSGIIEKADVNSTNRSNLVTGGNGKGYTGVTLDTDNGRLYWTEINTSIINSIKTDGTDFKAGITTGLDRPQYITFYNGKIYWTEAGITTQCVKSASVDANGNISGVTTLHSAVNPCGIVVGPSPSALPVELTSFTASANINGVELKWNTATEINNFGFQVERCTAECKEHSTESKIWEMVGFVEGRGNSNSPKVYSFVDNNPPSGNLQYRLKQIDTDGSFEYYPTIAEISFNLTDVEEKQFPTEFALEQNYPNPFNPETVISYTIGTSQLSVFSHASLKIYDILGNELATLVNEYQQPGYYNVRFNGSNLSSGIYIYRLTTGTFTSTKKLMLMK